MGGYRTKNAYLVTTPRHDQDAQRLLSVVFGPLGLEEQVDQLRTGAGAELAVDATQVEPDGLGAEEQRRGVHLG